MQIAPSPKGTDTTIFFLSNRSTFECIVNAFFCCLDNNMTDKFGFTLSFWCYFFCIFLISFLFDWLLGYYLSRFMNIHQAMAAVKFEAEGVDTVAKE